ncbi:MAG: autotransporter-associated beta strand repeat-containing protein, partial [Planctomycetaceae bacterium]
MMCNGSVACLVAMAVCAAAPALAQNTWTGSGTSSFWSDPGNWSGPVGSPTPPTVDAMLFFVGSSGTASVNDAAVTSVAPRVIGSSYGITFLNDGLAGKTAGFRISGSPLVLKGNIETYSATTSPALAITDEIACDLQLTLTDFTQIYTRSFGSFAHNLLVSGVISENGAPRTLRKNGTGGTLALTGENVFTGQMQISVGIVTVDRVENISQPSPLGAGNLPVRLGQGQTGGTLIYTGSGEANNRYFQIGSGPNSTATGGGTITANGSGPVVFTAVDRDLTHPLYGNDYFNQNDGAVIVPDRTLTLNGTSAGGNEIRTVIIDNVNATSQVVSKVNVTKAGSGTWILSGTNTYTGTTTIAGGMLQVGSGGTVGRLGPGPVINNATLAFNRSDDATVSNVISGSGRLVKAGAGSVTFTAPQLYTGATRVDAGTLSLGETGAIAASPSVTVAAGAALSVADVPGGVYAIPVGQSVGGDGTVVGNLSISGGATVTPGASPGTLAVTDGVVFGPGGNYNWQMLSAVGTAGSPTSWDLVDAGGELTIAATPADPFRLNLWTLSGVGPDISGNATNFDPFQAYSWRIAAAAGGITGFSADKFAINVSATNGTGGFTNSLSGGTFSVAQSGTALNL